MASSSTSAAPPFGITPEQLEQLVMPDPHRPGWARWRLSEFNVPIWALIVDLQSTSNVYDATEASPAAIQKTAEGFSVSEFGVRVALAYYVQNRAYIDAFLLLNNDV